MLANISSDRIVAAIDRKYSLDFLAPRVLDAQPAELFMSFDEGAEMGHPQHVRQARISVDRTIALDQVTTPSDQTVG